MPYLKINYDDSKPPFDELEFPDEPIAWLDACYAAIDCSTIQIVPTVLRGIVLVIDEEGKLWDDWWIRFNKIATLLHSCRYDPIVGDAILARLDGENLVPLTSLDIDRLRRHFA